MRIDACNRGKVPEWRRQLTYNRSGKIRRSEKNEASKQRTVRQLQVCESKQHNIIMGLAFDSIQFAAQHLGINEFVSRFLVLFDLVNELAHGVQAQAHPAETVTHTRARARRRRKDSKNRRGMKEGRNQRRSRVESNQPAQVNTDFSRHFPLLPSKKRNGTRIRS